jgi:hypothetical protein
MNARLWRTLGTFALVVAAALAAAIAVGLAAVILLPRVIPATAATMAEVRAVFAPAKLGDYAQIAAALFILPTIYVAWRSLSENERIAFLNTRATVILHCATRYDQLYQDRSASGIDTYKRGTDYEDPSLVSVRRYFRRYWGLQSDQMDFYMADWVDPDTIRSWVYSLCEAVRETGADGEPTNFATLMRMSWARINAYHSNVNPVFAEMVQLIMELAPQARDKAAALRLTDALLLEIERRTEVDREMTQRPYSMKEFLRRNERMPAPIDPKRIARALEA